MVSAQKEAVAARMTAWRACARTTASTPTHAAMHALVTAATATSTGSAYWRGSNTRSAKVGMGNTGGAPMP